MRVGALVDGEGGGGVFGILYPVVRFGILVIDNFCLGGVPDALRVGAVLVLRALCYAGCGSDNFKVKAVLFYRFGLLLGKFNL